MDHAKINPIKKLDTHLVNKIAAGEVVERPLSVVKELTENAVDAGASSITVEIKDGGLSLIRVTDNGSGIPADQVLLAFDQHATSKIRDIDDLMQIGTLGFRGEALASIAAVSHVEIITKTAGAVSGVRAELHGGTLISRQELGTADGTTINVSNIFFNTPARLKFLKKPAQEAGYVTDLMQRLALGYPKLAFRYISNGQMLITTTGNGDLKMAVYHIYGKEAAKGLIPVESELISGYIGKPEIARGSRSAENFFINGRYIRCEVLRSAVEEVYRTRLPIGRFPLCVLHLTIPPGQVDVNVHPTKMEVRFANEQEIAGQVIEALSKALSTMDLTPAVTINYAAKDAEEYTFILSEEYVPETPKAVSDQLVRKSDQLERDFQPTFKPDDFDSVKLEEKPEFVVIGQVFTTYWLAVKEDELFIIDQHAAHERILYEEMWNKLDPSNCPSQSLLEPTVIFLSPDEQEKALEYREQFENYGFQFNAEGHDKILVSSVPLFLKSPVDSVFFTRILDKLDPKTQLRDELAMAACKAAVKANDNMSAIEARTLIYRMLALENPYSCPHGRPTMIKMSKKEIESMFKRT